MILPSGERVGTLIVVYVPLLTVLSYSAMPLVPRVVRSIATLLVTKSPVFSGMPVLLVTGRELTALELVSTAPVVVVNIAEEPGPVCSALPERSWIADVAVT